MFSISRPLLIVAIAALAVATLTAGYQRLQAKRYKAEAAQAVQTAKQLSAAYESAQATITALEGSVDAMQEAAAVRQAELAQAARDATALREGLRERDRRISKLEKSDHAIPDCAALLAADLSVCPGHSGGVRERANGGL